MKLNIVYNKKISDYQIALDIVEQAVLDKKIEFKSFNIDNLETFGDLTLVIGGDGTLLKTAKFYADTNTPVLGINLGRLGFLAQAGVSEINNILNSIINHEFFIEERMMLTCGEKTALNDFVIKGCNTSRTSKFFLEINEKFVCDYIADGLIISTPTGSTAYGLSAGGPVVYPTLDAITIIPICPHTLNARPLVIPAQEVIKVKSADTLLSVAIDGSIANTDGISHITVKTSPQKAKLAFLNNTDFYSVLRNKLHWGISPTVY